MNPRNRKKLDERVAGAAQRVLTAKGHVSPLDVLIGIGWLDEGAVGRWRQGRFDCLEEAVQANPARISEAMRQFQAWAAARGLVASETAYVARTPQRETLRFSKSGDPAIERLYRTHWVSGALSERKREQLISRESRAPELVVILPLNDEWMCHRCGGGGDLLMMEPEGPACLRCVGLDGLEFLPMGSAALTRRAKAESASFAVVVRFSRARRRYERQGLLVEPRALAIAQAEHPI